MDYRSGRLIAGPRRDSAPGFISTVELLTGTGADADADTTGDTGQSAPPLSNTTIGVVATDARLNREEANLLARVSHDGLALAIRPCHTIRDGDTMFALATGQGAEPGDFTALGAGAVEVTAQAVLRAVTAATGLGGVPAVGELANG